ncbi:MAG: YtxH domain-containing protein [Thermodesulfobacteriota bacterium]
MASDDRGYSAGAVVLSFFIGSLVGAGLAVLLAPASGRETREKIKGWADTGKDRIAGLGGELKEKAAHVFEHGKEYYEQKKQILSSAIEAGREAMEKEKSRLSATESGTTTITD